MTIQKRPKVVGLIPARYGSTRFPGKPLAEILGKSLIQRTYESSKNCTLLDDIYVATDDDRISTHVLSFGGKVVMTSSNCPTGSDRLIEAVQTDERLKDVDIIINIQGDQPCIETEVIEKVIELLIEDPSAHMSTAIMRIETELEANNPSVVKCSVDKNGHALYFSRALIPAGLKGFNPSLTYFKHIGIYGYRKDFLLKYGELEQTPLQIAEDLEQLKVLEHGYKIKTALVESHSLSVDNPEDINKVELQLCKQNTYS
jgi:3-deoxy-manno-octulosonate cytidylyltransferase (CMP-KDO synthetase)